MIRFVMPFGLVLVEAYFFYSRETMDNELFFFIWTFVFGAFFLFRFVDGETGVFGIGRSDRDVIHNLATKATETIFQSNKVKRVQLPLLEDLLLLGFCLINLVLTFVAPGI